MAVPERGRTGGGGRAALRASLGAVDVVPVGQRQAFTRQVRELVSHSGDLVREGLATPEVVADYVATIKAGVKIGSRTEMNLYAQIMRLVGEEKRITVEFINSLGATSESQLRSYVDAAKSVEGASLHDSAERCVAFLELFFNANPELRSAAVKRLGGYVPVEAG